MTLRESTLKRKYESNTDSVHCCQRKCQILHNSGNNGDEISNAITIPTAADAVLAVLIQFN